MKNQSASVFISTTHGLVEVLSVTALLDPELESVVTINHTSQLAGISKAYHDFVEPPQGIIKQDFGGLAYRINLSRNIDQGESWQLGIYVAHCLHSHGLLKKIDEQRNHLLLEDEIVFIATGKIDTISNKVLAIDELERKCLCANNDIKKWQQQQKQIVFLVPHDNLRVPIPDTAIALSPITNIQELASLLRVYFPVTLDSQALKVPINEKEQQTIEEAIIVNRDANEKAVPKDKPSRRSLPIVFGAAAFVFLLAVFLFQNWRSDEAQVLPSFFVFTASTSNTDSCGFVDMKLIQAAELPTSVTLATSTFKKPRLRLCELSLYLRQQSQDVVLVSESKALIRLSVKSRQGQKILQNEIVKNALNKDVLNDYADAVFRQWSIPIPSNQALTRSYHLMIFNQALDDADIQSLESYLENLHYQNRPHTSEDLRKWHSRVKSQTSLNIIHHSLEF